MSGPLSNPYMFKSAAGATGIYPYQITNSLRLNGTSQALEKSFSSAASDDNKKALSFWIKRSGASGTNSAFGSTTNTKLCSASTGNGATGMSLEINTNNPTGYSDQFHYYNASGGGNFLKAKWRDPSAWIHIVWIYNSDESTTTDRIKVYINGESNTINDSNYWDNDGNNGYPSSGADTSFGLNGNEMHIGRYVYDDAGWWGGQMADFIMIDGAASISDFGETYNGIWRPKDPSGLTFGTNGFWLKFTNASNPGEDFSGNDNDFTNIGSIATHDILTDTPTFNSDSNGGNFATYNPLTKGSYTDLSEGNCRADSNTGADASYPSGNFAMLSGKWYYEQLIGNLTNSYPSVGLVACNNVGYDLTRGTFYAMRLRSDTGVAQQNSGDNIAPFGTITVNTTGVASVGTGDIVSWYVDMDNKKAWFAKNGTIANSGDPANGTNPQFSWTENPLGGITFMSQEYQTSYTVFNGGQDGTFAGEKTAQGNSDDTGYGNFYYDPPTGFLALCSGNLPLADAINPAETSDDYPQKLFNTIIYTGDNGGSFTTGFQPDLVWVKRRDDAQSNGLWDSSRGTTKVLNSNTTGEEATSSGLTSFDSTGYTMGTYYNQTGNTYVSWSWRANGGTTSTDNNGSVSSTVQADPSGSFSMVKFVGGISGAGTETVGHGLNKAPSMIINFCYDDLDGGDGNRWVRSDGLTNWNYVLKLNGTSSPIDKSGNGNMSAPTSTVFSINNTDILGAGSQKIISYCFANMEGFCKVGTYEGNGSTDGTFIYTGFKPKFVLFKRTNRSGDYWYIIDPVRNPFNGPGSRLLNSDRDVGESGNATTDVIDILSNGFKFRTSGSGMNGSGGEWIFLAMAHNPFKYATAR